MAEVFKRVGIVSAVQQSPHNGQSFRRVIPVGDFDYWVRQCKRTVLWRMAWKRNLGKSQNLFWGFLKFASGGGMNDCWPVAPKRTSRNSSEIPGTEELFLFQIHCSEFMIKIYSPFCQLKEMDGNKIEKLSPLCISNGIFSFKVYNECRYWQKRL
jgi:hypothetical protein